MRKKVKRFTGELDVLETYFCSFSTLLRQSSPFKTAAPLQKVLSSIEDSVEYMKELFANSSLNVAQGKKVQRKIRYEKLKTEF